MPKFLLLFPPSISVPFFYIYVTGMLLLRFLLGTVFGWLLLALAIYSYVGAATSIEPFGIQEMALWIDNLPRDYKIALFSSLITVVGFVIAFHTATAQWRRELQAHLQLEIAGEIEVFFSTVGRNVTTTTIYVEELVDTVKQIQGDCSDEEADFWLAHVMKGSTKFVAARDDLARAQSEIHRLFAKHPNALMSFLGLPARGRELASSLEKITDIMWIHIPIVNIEDPNRFSYFLRQVNVLKCQQYLDVCERVSPILHGGSGGIRGRLTAPVWGFTLSSLVNLAADRKMFRESLTEIYNSKRNGT